MKNRKPSARAAVLQNPLLRKSHAHELNRRQERKIIRRQLAKHQWDDQSAVALR